MFPEAWEQLAPSIFSRFHRSSSTRCYLAVSGTADGYSLHQPGVFPDIHQKKNPSAHCLLIPVEGGVFIPHEAEIRSYPR